jgi:3-dehydroquinate dehydratase-2
MNQGAHVVKVGERTKILIASGVNLDLLGMRQPEIYGHATLADMERLVTKLWREEFDNSGFSLVFFQTNDEAIFLTELSKGYAGAVINAGAWTHTSLAIADRLVGLGLPFVEAHVSKLDSREAFRQHSYMRPFALAVIDGHGIQSYWLGLQALMSHLKVLSRP